MSDGSLLSRMMNIEEAGSANIPSSVPENRRVLLSVVRERRRIKKKGRQSLRFHWMALMHGCLAYEIRMLGFGLPKRRICYEIEQGFIGFRT
ncbi:hypothetical protein HNY73_022659 [Argiope bruennichi]|uniref:Uncharacterized protein n=1 Tax=Argiope bruennichi TaxID=94029 RepID=A0A8T0E331_ARGBR|nr:hypothetical protein HNY73_022659 [Argiope bruennichi]